MQGALYAGPSPFWVSHTYALPAWQMGALEMQAVAVWLFSMVLSACCPHPSSKGVKAAEFAELSCFTAHSATRRGTEPSPVVDSP